MFNQGQDSCFSWLIAHQKKIEDDLTEGDATVIQSVPYCCLLVIIGQSPVVSKLP